MVIASKRKTIGHLNQVNADIKYIFLLPGPPYVHLQCEPLRERPPLLQDLQRQSAGGVRQVLIKCFYPFVTRDSGHQAICDEVVGDYRRAVVPVVKILRVRRHSPNILF